MNKKILSLALAWLTFVVLTAGAAGADLTFLMWPQADPDWWFQQVEEFEKINNVDVDVMSLPGGQFNDKLSSMIAAGTPPDVHFVRLGDYPTFALKGVLLDITQYVEKDQELQSVLLPEDKPRSMVNGRWYGLGQKFAFAHAYYSKLIFDQVGLAPMPIDGDNAWSWDEFVQALKKITVVGGDGNTDRYGLTMPVHWLRTGSVLKTFGVDFVGEDGFDISSPAAKDATNALVELYQQGLQAPPNLGGKRRDFLQSGKTGIIFDIDSAPHTAFSDNGKDFSWYGVGAYPAGIGQSKGSSYMFGENIAVNAETKHPELSYKLLKFLVMRAWRLDSETPYMYQGRPVLHPEEKALAMKYALDDTTVVHPFPGFSQGVRSMGAIWRPIFEGEKSLASLDEAQKELDQTVADVKASIAAAQ